MEFRAQKPNDATAIERLFLSVFTKSEGEREGTMISNLAKEMMATTDRADLFGFVANDGDQIVGAIFFSRLTFEADFNVFILSPVAVDTAHQGIGIGQTLITHGLREIEKRDVRFVITYGDPAFYTKVGFHSISRNAIGAPFVLSQPEGWLGQSLAGEQIETIVGRCSCVTALNNPVYW